MPRSWPHEPPVGQILVNLSPKQLASPRLVERIELILAAAQVPPDALGFEVTETLLIEHFDYAADVMSRIRRLGCPVGLDDFGTGYSSLSYLRRLPLDFIKIDGELIAGIDSDAGSPIHRRRHHHHGRRARPGRHRRRRRNRRPRQRPSPTSVAPKHRATSSADRHDPTRPDQAAPHSSPSRRLLSGAGTGSSPIRRGELPHHAAESACSRIADERVLLPHAHTFNQR